MVAGHGDRPLESGDPALAGEGVGAFIQSSTTHDGQRGLEGAYLWEHLWASLWRILRGLFWGIVVGVPLGFALAAIPWFRKATEPYVSFLRSLPPLGYFSLLIIWFGIDDTSKIWLLFLAAFPPIALATMAGRRAVRPEHLESRSVARRDRGCRWCCTRCCPSSLPDVFTGIRIAARLRLDDDRRGRDVERNPRHRRPGLGHQEAAPHRRRDPLRDRHRPHRRCCSTASSGRRARRRPVEGPRLTVGACHPPGPALHQRSTSDHESSRQHRRHVACGSSPSGSSPCSRSRRGLRVVEELDDGDGGPRRLVDRATTPRRRAEKITIGYQQMPNGDLVVKQTSGSRRRSPTPTSSGSSSIRAAR